MHQTVDVRNIKLNYQNKIKGKGWNGIVIELKETENFDPLNLVENSFRAQIEPTTIPNIADMPTAKVAMYAVIKALFQYSDKAMKSINPPTIKHDLIPPII